MDAFGKDAAVDMMLQLHNECDPYGCRILKRFLEERNLKRIIQDISLHRKKELSQYLTSTLYLQTVAEQQAQLAEPFPA